MKLNCVKFILIVKTHPSRLRLLILKLEELHFWFCFRRAFSLKRKNFPLLIVLCMLLWGLPSVTDSYWRALQRVKTSVKRKVEIVHCCSLANGEPPWNEKGFDFPVSQEGLHTPSTTKFEDVKGNWHAFLPVLAWGLTNLAFGTYLDATSLQHQEAIPILGSTIYICSPLCRQNHRFKGVRNTCSTHRRPKTLNTNLHHISE